LLAASGSEFFFFQLDTAHLHHIGLVTNKDTAAILEQVTPDFIPPTLLPLDSFNLSPVDYSEWSVLQQRVRRAKISNIDELKQRINREL